MPHPNETIIVTGGTGFIGSHLVALLIAKGYKKIVVIDKELVSDSYFSSQKLQNKVTVEILDIREKNKVFSVFKKYNPSFVFHLAAEPIVFDSYIDPISTFETNIMGTVFILEAVRKLSSIKCVIVASSDKAYGKTDKAYTESSPLRGDHPYDVSKSSADLISQAYFKTYQTPVIVTRFGNVYGEGDLHLDRIIPGICESIAKEKPLMIRSDGTYVRDYLYVQDVVMGYVTLLNKYEQIIGESFNFSSDTTLSVLDVIKRAEKTLKRSISHRILNSAKNEIPYQHLDDKKIRKLGWKREFSFDKGLKNTFNWYEKYFSVKK